MCYVLTRQPARCLASVVYSDFSVGRSLEAPDLCALGLCTFQRANGRQRPLGYLQHSMYHEIFMAVAGVPSGRQQDCTSTKRREHQGRCGAL